jgi:hypothetical protein
LYIKQGHFIPSSHQLSQVGKITNQKKSIYFVFQQKPYIFDRAQIRRLRWPTYLWNLISMLPILDGNTRYELSKIYSDTWWQYLASCN